MSNFIDSIRERIATYKLNKQLKNSPRTKYLHNLNTAKTAGILYDATIEENHLLVKDLIKELKTESISSKALGFIDVRKREDNYIGDKTYSFACRKDFSFFYAINKESIQAFVNKPFSILIVLVNEQPFAIDYLGQLSQAEFKVGKAGLDNDLYDLMIELKEKDGIKELKKQIMHYLRLLNNN
ncbi:hypothetical protein [Carboxylicivirga sp. M1479]|uniref:DUF6913 domain-containing protein n=1 Tax=Carboxylicivirga sp. M1479 TaxID=2594476 RepID=UPI001177E36C|nr:hypothetical protein [Carboxylicivirga sp. M1479]TRX70594.1 hypothetical protein FNN09_11505 [Carboxylicivirga sp. M1479]